MLIFSRAEVERLLDPDRLVDFVARAMADLSAGATSMPRRIAAVAEAEGILGAMAAYVPSLEVLATKLVSLFPHNRDRPTHQALVLCFDPATGTPIALMDGTHITAARTAAGSALATKLLAREEVRILAILGTGVQAESHARAVTRVREFERLVVAGRDPVKAASLAERLGKELGTATAVATSFETACREADVVCAATHSPDPVVRRDWISAGVHVNSVGFNPEGREVDAATVRDSLVVIESRDATLAPFPSGSNDLLWALRDGEITADHIHAEIGEVVLGKAPGRTSPDQITLYKSVGVAVQDAAAAALVLDGAKDRSFGREFDLG